MAEIVNLRLARKRRRRGQAEKAAAENRTKHGRTGGDKAAARVLRDLEARRLEGHRRDRADESGDT
jgi:hypothetical protein